MTISPEHKPHNRLRGFDWPWTLSNVHDDFKRLWPAEVARVWGEAIWTAPDLWRVS